MRRWRFKARLLKDDARTGFKKGHKFDPLGFYYNGKSIILAPRNMSRSLGSESRRSMYRGTYIRRRMYGGTRRRPF